MPSVVAWRGTTSDKPVQSQMSEPVQDTKLESTEESTMTTSKSKVVPGLHKDHKPREEDNILVGYNNFKKLTPEKIEVGLPIARKSITSCGEVASICVVASVVRNEQLPGGGMVKMETVWFSSGYEGVNKRRVHSSATFHSLCTSHANYRVYPFNIEQPLPTPEPEPVKRPEIVVAPPMFDLAGLTMPMYDNKHSSYERETDEAFLAINKDNNRLLTEILATLKELKDKW